MSETRPCSYCNTPLRPGWGTWLHRGMFYFCDADYRMALQIIPPEYLPEWMEQEREAGRATGPGVQ